MEPAMRSWERHSHGRAGAQKQTNNMCVRLSACMPGPVSWSNIRLGFPPRLETPSNVNLAEEAWPPPPPHPWSVFPPVSPEDKPPLLSRQSTALCPVTWVSEEHSMFWLFLFVSMPVKSQFIIHMAQNHNLSKKTIYGCNCFQLICQCISCLVCKMSENSPSCFVRLKPQRSRFS